MNEGRRVVFLCEGDPLFYGSLAYLLDRLRHHRCSVVPGIASPLAAAAELCEPLARLSDDFAVFNGRHDDATLSRALAEHANIAILKVGRERDRLRALIEASGRTAEARYVEYVGRDNQRVVTDLTRLEAGPGPYFSLLLITAGGRA